MRSAIHSVNGLSAHADKKALLEWAGAFRKPPAQTFVVHGEATAAQALADALSQMPGWRVTVPERGDTKQWPNNPVVEL